MDRRDREDWQAERDAIGSALEVVDHFYGFPQAWMSDAGDGGLDSSERIYLVVDGIGLVEECRDPASRERLPAVVDTGRATITDRRIVFHGAAVRREWPFESLLSYCNLDAAPMTALQVVGTAEAVGLLYDDASARAIQVRVATAIARRWGTVELLRECLLLELDQVEGRWSDQTRRGPRCVAYNRGGETGGDE